MCGMRQGKGDCHRHGMEPGFGGGFWQDRPASLLDEADWLKRHKDRLQLRQKELEAEQKAVEERIAKLEK